MQSSAMNCFPVRLKTSIHSAALSRCGPDGTRPTGARSLVAVDKTEAAEARLLAAFAAAPSEEAHGRAGPAGDEEAGSERTRSENRELPAQVRLHVRDLSTELVDSLRELLAFGLDLAPELLSGARSAATGGCRHGL